jgi:hypothetical protein
MVALVVAAAALLVSGFEILATYNTALRTCSTGLWGCANLDNQVFQRGTIQPFFRPSRCLRLLVTPHGGTFPGGTTGGPRVRRGDPPPGLGPKRYPAALVGGQVSVCHRGGGDLYWGRFRARDLVVPPCECHTEQPFRLGHLRHSGPGPRWVRPCLGWRWAASWEHCCATT